MHKVRIGWMSHHVEGLAPLEALIAAKCPIACILTLERDLLAKKSGAADYEDLARSNGIAIHRIKNVNNPESLELIEMLDLDVLFVIGWSQILHKPVLSLVKIGCFGAHASLLPANRGSAPINWALIKGESKTGNTLMKLTPEVDSGAIVAQRAFDISPYDTVATLYEKVGNTNTEMLLELADRLLLGLPLDAESQISVDSALLPRRRPEDGVIDWHQTAPQVYDFVRALTRPYPGAFSSIDGRRYFVWRVALLPMRQPAGEPGAVIGPVTSFSEASCGLLVSCGIGAILLLEIEDEAGKVFVGRELAELKFKGCWSASEQAHV